ncbi:MAG: hypothetical protein QOF36_645 [Microbacteriaceae bacterium]|nr:hypothetical protein [Microbacteriaceae bacterium]
MPRIVLLWSIIGAVLLVAFGAAVGTVQRDVYSAGGLVSGYLDALARHDARAALALPGVDVTPARLSAAGLPRDASRELLRGDILANLHGITISRDERLSDDRHRVTAEFQLGSTAGTTTFMVQQTGAMLGIFPTWRFAESPLAIAEITVLHGDSFEIAGHTLNTRAGTPAQPATFTTRAAYLVFAPGAYGLSHNSTLLAARPVTTTVTNPGAITRAFVDVRPTAAFTARVQKQLNGFLDTCTSQHVLQPTGCPFGAQIDDRVQGTPNWRMVSYPPVTLTAGPDGWQMPGTQGVAHLTAEVQSLFDGAVSTNEQDEPFDVSLTSVVVLPDGAIDITVAD